jgi:hypothetical protein
MKDHDLPTPDDDPQRVWEWRGSFWSVFLPLFLVALVTAAILAYFYFAG